MKKFKNNIILCLLLLAFASLFVFSKEIKVSVISSCELWLYNLVPSMLPLYIILDLLINYGLGNILYKTFKTNSILLVIISLIGGTPGNAKYIKEFEQNGYISKDLGNYLLTFAYSPNPLFIIAISPNMNTALTVLGAIYATNFINFIIFRKKFINRKSSQIERSSLSLSEVLEQSINKSFNILILILGIVVVYGILNTLFNIYQIDSCLVSSIFELTNALNIITNGNYNIFWMIFACLFSGLSIHTQIKSILENTDLSYRYFLYGRLLSSLPFLILAVLNPN